MSLGFDPTGFWKLSPRELKLQIDGANQRLEREHNDRAWLAWHVAALSRQKRMPRLQVLQIKKRAPRQTWEDHLRIMAAIPGVVTTYPQKESIDG